MDLGILDLNEGDELDNTGKKYEDTGINMADKSQFIIP